MGFLKTVTKIGTKAVKNTKKIGNNVSSTAKALANSAVKGTSKVLKATVKPTGIFNTTAGKAMVALGKQTNQQTLMDVGRTYKAAGRLGKQAAKKHPNKKRFAKGIKKLEKQGNKAIISSAIAFA
jgi:hypothetical protein